MQPLLLLLAYHLLPGTVGEEIIGGHEAQPHSRPYMALVVFLRDGNVKICGGFLVEEDIVLTAAHCWASPMNVILGVHDIYLQENTQQNIRVKKAIPHPNNVCFRNDIMILQGDSGGPLVCNNVAHAVCSSLPEKDTSPCIFTKITSFLPWIKETIKGLHMEESP
ncbi:PREDICTED: granzyme H-like [Elephantulus edwardii]|uniref:granzyme H-like n=1 Tax=Elephantulus edwardii TaxID=28737 RepID=UPI0003F0D813|nr:PREDICTED: granzyme H-like [Elephantulus edwardii]